MKNILVTGSNGFIGSSLINTLAPLEYKIYHFNIEDGDIADPDSLKVFNDKNIEHVIHLAGRTFVPDSWKNPAPFYATNVMGTANILEFCRLNQCSLTHISAYLYGPPEKLPISEDSTINPNNPYAHSKHMAENLCRFYHDTFNTEIIILRPFNVFGSGQNKIFLVPSIVDQVLNAEIITVKDLVPKRDFIYLEDISNAIIKTLSCKKQFGIYNIGSGHSISVKDIIDEIQAVFRTNKEIISQKELRKGEISDVVADISRAKAELDWKPEFSFREGLEKMYKEVR